MAAAKFLSDWETSMTRTEILKTVERERILYFREAYLAHFLRFSKAQQIFSENYETNMAGGIHLRSRGHGFCHIAGKSADTEPNPYREYRLEPSASVGENKLKDLREITRRKKRGAKPSTNRET